MTRLGLDEHVAWTGKPTIVYCSVSGYGQTDPSVEHWGHGQAGFGESLDELVPGSHSGGGGHGCLKLVVTQGSLLEVHSGQVVEPPTAALVRPVQVAITSVMETSRCVPPPAPRPSREAQIPNAAVRPEARSAVGSEDIAPDRPSGVSAPAQA
jgi:hypothetical protein